MVIASAYAVLGGLTSKYVLANLAVACLIGLT